MTQDGKEESAARAATLETPQEQETVGTLLHKTRLAKKQDLRDIASYLCIRYQFLQALEENRYKELPGEAYANGFVRSYAAYLGLDAADIISRYKREVAGQDKIERGCANVDVDENENAAPAPKVLLASLAALLVVYGMWQAFSGEKAAAPVEPEHIESVTVVEDSYPLPPETSAAAGQEAAAASAAPEKTAAETVVPPVPPVKPEYAEPAENNAAVPARTEEKKPEEIPAIRVYGQKNYKPRLVLIAKEPVWVEVTRGENVLFSRLMNAGDRYQVSSNKPEELFLKTGNAGGLEVWCDGRLAKTLGPRGALRSGVALIPENFAVQADETAADFE